MFDWPQIGCCSQHQIQGNTCRSHQRERERERERERVSVLIPYSPTWDWRARCACFSPSGSRPKAFSYGELAVLGLPPSTHPPLSSWKMCFWNTPLSPLHLLFPLPGMLSLVSAWHRPACIQVAVISISPSGSSSCGPALSHTPPDSETKQDPVGLLGTEALLGPPFLVCRK